MKKAGPHMIFCLLPVVLITFLVQTGSAKDVKVYSLQKAVAEALANNLSLQAKGEELVQARHRHEQARADFLPKLSMSYGYSRLSEQSTFRSTLGGGAEIAVSSQNNYQWKGSLIQPVFTGFALLSSYELAKLGFEDSQAAVELEKLDLTLQVKEAYFNVLIAEKSIEVARRELESLESNLEVAQNFYDVGMIPVNDLLKAEVELADARQKLVKARNALEAAHAAFNVVLARPIGAPLRVKDILAYTLGKVDFEDCAAKALKNRPEVQILDISILKAEQQIRLARSENYPEVSLIYDYIKEGDGPDVAGGPFHDANRWQATAALEWTFWEWGKTRAKMKEKKSLRKELYKTKEALEEVIRLEVKRAFLELETATENIPTTQKAVTQAEENLRVNEERYKAQVTTMTEVLDAQTLLTRARVNYFQALYDQHLAQAKLERAIGSY